MGLSLASWALLVLPSRALAQAQNTSPSLVVLPTQRLEWPKGFRRVAAGQEALLPAEIQSRVQDRQQQSNNNPAADKVPLLVATFVWSGGNTASASAVPSGRAVLVAEAESCFLRSAQLSLEGTPPAALAPLVRPVAVDRLLPERRLEPQQSSVRLEVPGVGSQRALLRLLHEVAAAQESETLGFPVRSAVLASSCRAAARVHRSVVLRYPMAASSGSSGQGPSNFVALPEQAPPCEFVLSPFGQKLVPANTPPSPLPSPPPLRPWRALSCLDELANHPLAVIESVDKDRFSIIERRGRWVILNASRTSGLVIGSRLVGPGQATLHVIRLGAHSEARHNNRDRATAYVRFESGSRPLAPGDEVTLDPTVVRPDQALSDPSP